MGLLRWLLEWLFSFLFGDDDVAQQVTVTAAGLYLAPNDLGAVPDGALAQADNAVISKEGILEQHRGVVSVGTKALVRLWPFKGYMVGWAASGVLSRSSDSGATWADYSGAYPAPGVAKTASVEASGNLYFTTAAGPYRLDSFTGTPEPAGVQAGLDVQATLGAAGTAVPPNTQVAYRMVWGKRDANGNLLLGAPTGRAVVIHPAPYVVAIGGLVRAGSTVTATLAVSSTNVLQVGESVTLSPGEANFAAGTKTIATVTPSTFTYTEAGAAASNTAAQTFAGPSRDITVTGSIPRNLPSGAMYQVYRSPNSNLASVTPGDDLGLIYEGTPPLPSTLTQLSRASFSTVTATTSAAHGYQTGNVVQIPQAVGAGTIVSVGSASAAATSPDGITWTARTIPAGDYYSVTYNGTVFVAVGFNVAATSPDGITWTARTIPAAAYYSVAWDGSVFAAIGASAAATSPDGITWTARTIPAGFYYAVAWNGSVFAAVGVSVAATSPDGVTWTARTIPAASYAGCVWSGSVFCAVGNAGKGAVSADGITWSATTLPPDSSGVVQDFRALAWSGSLFVAGSNGSTSSTIATSADGVNWVSRIVVNINAVAWVGGQYVGVAFSNAFTSPNGVTWTAHAMPPGPGAYLAVAVSGSFFGTGEKTVTGAPTATTFTYSEFGGNGTVATSQTITPLTTAFTDTVPSGFIGAALYTNPSQGTLTASADRISLCQRIAMFRGFMFAADITYPSRANLYLLSVGGAGGIAAGDFISIDGVQYTATPSSESATNRTFITYSSGTPSQNIANTAQSLVRIINRSLTNTITARYLSGADDVPGLIYLEENGTAATMTLSFSRPPAWSIQSLKGPENRKNEVRWSSSGQPDAMPLLNYQAIGSFDKRVQAIVPTRDMLVIVKDDGLWRLTGWNGVWDIQPLDPTMGTPASQSLVAFENAQFGLLDSGVARATESGVEMLSTPIYPAIESLLAPAVASTLEAVAFGIAYHSSHKYIMWLPNAAGDTVAKQAYVYDSWTNTWVRWLPPTGITGWAHGMVNPADDRLYMVDGVNVYRERKAMDDTDLADLTSTAIPLTVKFTPRFGRNPGQLHHFQEVALVFRRVRFTTATVGFSSNISPAEETITLNGSDYGVDVAAGTQTTIRVLVPLEKARASQLNVRFTHSEAGSPCQIQGLSVVYRPTSTRVGR